MDPSDPSHLIKDERYDEAEAICDGRLAHNENDLIALAYKGVILNEFGKHDEAIKTLRKASSIAPNDPSIMCHLVHSLCSTGQFREGFKLLYYITWESPIDVYGLPIERFSGKEVFNWQPPPAVINLHDHAGFGDNFAMLRYVPMLIEKGYKIKYQTKKPVIKLSQDSFPEVEFYSPRSNELGPESRTEVIDFDYNYPILCLPHLFGTDIDTVPCNGPYLKADPKLVEQYKDHKGKIGLCWSTGDHRSTRRMKSVPFPLLEPLISAIGAYRCVSVQSGPPRLEAFQTITDCLPRDERLLIWADTAALIENLDLVISIDTSVAHLAGAMGKPTYLMMHKTMTSWQFLSESPGASWNTHSPWYPTMKVFRQKTRGEWEPVINSIREELIHRD